MKHKFRPGMALALLLCILLLAGCGASGGASRPKDTTLAPLGGASDSAVPGESTAPETPEETPVREYGQTASYISLDGPLVIRAEYPAGDIPALDEAVENWVKQTAENFQAQMDPGADNGSFRTDYICYEVDGRVVSVRMTGRFTRSHGSLPKTVSAAFHADRTTGELLHLSDLVCDGSQDALEALVLAQIGAYPYGQSPLADWLLTGDGLRLYLPDGSTQEFPYEELEGILALPGDKAPDVPEQPAQSEGIDPDKPMVALTFDDGPYSPVTDRLLDLLEQYGGKATFFVVGNRVSSYTDSVQRAVDLGCEIGIHTWEHANLTKLGEDGILKQIDKTQAALQETAGYTSAVVRPPGGACNDFVKEVLGKQGLYLANWSVDTEDWKSRNADSVYAEAMRSVQDGAIILCHDLYPSTADAMERVIPELIEQGYQLVTVSELISYSEDGIVPGTLYRHQ